MSIKRNYEATYKYGQELSCDLVAGTFFIMETKNKKSTHFLTFSWCSLFLDTFFLNGTYCADITSMLALYDSQFTVYSNLSLSLKTNKQKKNPCPSWGFLTDLLFLLIDFVPFRNIFA